jgi:beta-phosphoglucomutase-like phosphatase (HAD superfamily)
MSFRAAVFDFNGTLSDDEHILYGVFADLFAEHGRPLTKADYFDTLAGLSDTAIVRTWLGERDDVDHVVGQRVSRYQAAVSDGASIGDGVRQAVRYAAGRVPIAIVSGAAQAEIEPVLEAAGLLDAFTAVVASDHVEDGKPHPEGYRRALALLSENGGPPLAGHEVVAFEDTEAGVLSAKAAGLRCVGVLGTLAAERLVAADELVGMIDEPLMRRLLG